MTAPKRASSLPAIRRIAAHLCTLSVLTALPAAAGKGLITVNQHPTATPTSCTYTVSCTPSEDPPFATIANGSNTVDVFAYHIAPLEGETDYTKGKFCKATCRYKYQGALQNRAKILSDDSPDVTLEAVQAWVQKVCDAATSWPGRLHFEHFDWTLNAMATDEAGDCIGGYDTWRSDARTAIGYFDDHGSSCPSILAPNGTLERGNGTARPENRLMWREFAPQESDDTVTLVGFGFMGGLGIGDRLDVDEFLRSLRVHRANLIRVWAVELWSALAPNNCGYSLQDEGPTPFVGEFVQFDNHGYSLDDPNPAFYSRLRSFAQKAADRGIVVQLSLFDKHGLLKRSRTSSCWVGRWPTSPYNSENNDDGFLDSDWAAGDCHCYQGEGHFDDPLENPCVPPPRFITDYYPEMPQIHEEFIRRVVQEVGGTGNVMFEIINEQVFPTDWPDTPGDPDQINDGEQWQLAMADRVRWELPVFVVRDAFNEEANGQGLANKNPDAGYIAWTAQNTQIYNTVDPQTGIKLGSVKGKSGGLPPGPVMRGALSLGSISPRTELGVRARVSTWGNSTMELGFSSSANPTANVVRVEVTPTLLLAACKRVAIMKIINGAPPIEIASTCAFVDDKSDLHLLVDLVAGSARVYIDGALIPQLSGVSINGLPSPLDWAFFRGSKPSGDYRDSDGEIDEFEASVYCTDPNRGCSAE